MSVTRDQSSRNQSRIELAAFDSVLRQAKAGCEKSHDLLLVELNRLLHAEKERRRRGGDIGQATRDWSHAINTSLIKVSRKIAQFDGDNFLSLYVYTVKAFRTACIDEIRRRRDSLVQAVDTPLLDQLAIELDQHEDGNDLHTSLMSAVNRLKPTAREFILLRYWEKLDFPKIGRLMGKDAAAARMACNRALDELRRMLRRG